MEEDSPKASSLRLEAVIRERVDAYAKKTRRTRNATVNHLLEIALDHVETVPADSPDA